MKINDFFREELKSLPGSYSFVSSILGKANDRAVASILSRSNFSLSTLRQLSSVLGLRLALVDDDGLVVWTDQE